jgi:2-hydroxychromene-2-carboxylate isomerase
LSETHPSPLGDAPAVCIDFKNPKAYLALRPTFALEDELDIVFDWWPVAVSPMSPPQPEQANEDRGARHRRIRAKYYASDTHRYASGYGLELADLHRNPDMTVAGVGLLWTKRQATGLVRRYLDVVFERYWQDRLRIDDAGEIETVLRDIGVDATGWSAYVGGTGRALFNASNAGLRDAGIFDVPAYVIDGDVFFGRQHLPMVRWLLTDKRGEPPI